MTAAVRERPILFSGEMVRAILAGRKTQTRRVVKDCPDPTRGHYLECGGDWSDWEPVSDYGGAWWFQSTYAPPVEIGKCPYGVVGDRLWLREAWRGTCDEFFVSVNYKADDSVRDFRGAPRFERLLDWSWRPSIHMPRWASRITLEVTGVRVERLQKITTDDITAEGINDGCGNRCGQIARENFAATWNNLNAKRGYPWESSPWVWVVEFKQIECSDDDEDLE